MILYNVTVSLTPEIEEEWLQWIQDEHIPEVLATQKFESAHLVKIYDEHQNATGSYAVQYKVTNQAQLTAYLKNDAERLRQKIQERFGNQLLTFRTFLNIITEQK